MHDRHIPSLDGLRALAVLAVIASHWLKWSEINSIHALQRLMDAGGTGVSIFFVISGFLITHILLEEQNSHGKISLAAFYIRRVFRIFPALYVYIGFVLLITISGFAEIKSSYFYASILFFINYIPHPSSYLAHLWSLAVEEQFYLLWPIAFVLLGKRNALVLAAIVIIACPFLRVALTVWGGPLRWQVGAMFPTRADSLMIGCGFAILRDMISLRNVAEILRGWAAHWLALVFLFLISPLLSVYVGGVYDVFFVYSLQGACVIAIFLVTIDAQPTALARLLNHRIAVWIGLRSYSLYLWQQPFFAGGFPVGPSLFPFNVLPPFLLAAISYRWVETPWRRIGRRLANRAVSAPTTPPPARPAR